MLSNILLFITEIMFTAPGVILIIFIVFCVVLALIVEGLLCVKEKL